MQVHVVIISIQLFSIAAATLTSTPTSTVACPDDTVTFTCTMPGSLIRWDVTPPQGARFSISLSTSNTEDTQGNPAFRGVLTDTRENLTATLTSLSEASTVEGTMVECVGVNSREGPLTITVADLPSHPLNPRVSSTLNHLSSSNITLDWDPSSFTGGVSVRYVFIISPTPLSGSPVTMDTTSIQITISYNTSYDVTITAVNCVGMSQEISIVDLIVCPTPSTAAGVTITNTPPVTIGGSMLTFTYSGDNEARTSTCCSNGWSPDPGTFDCGSLVTVNCSLPKEPSNGIIIVDYELLNETVLEGTVLTYQCDNRLSLTGPNTITCTNAGVWSAEPEAIMCVSPTEGPTTTSLSIGAVAAISIIITFFVAAILGFLTGLLVMHLCSRKKAVYSPAAKGQTNVGPTAQPAGPVYEEVSPKEEMELNTNQAYACGPVGL